MLHWAFPSLFLILPCLEVFHFNTLHSFLPMLRNEDSVLTLNACVEHTLLLLRNLYSLISLFRLRYAQKSYTTK